MINWTLKLKGHLNPCLLYANLLGNFITGMKIIFNKTTINLSFSYKI